ncbi:MAG: membrane dipeptidase [Tannerella sp.]|nr:membrane dipeptidase [Tannerella sp.]
MKRVIKTIWSFTGACFFLLSGHAQTEVSGYPDPDSFGVVTDSCAIDLRTHRPPLIGISVTRTGSGGAQLGATYIQAALKAGGIPVAIPAMTDTKALYQLVMHLDGLILSGGEDVAPSCYDEAPHPLLGKVDTLRDAYEFQLLKLASDRNMPVLGICRGEQVMNVYFGGTLYQDLVSQRGVSVGTRHRQKLPPGKVSHTVSVVPGSQLAAIVGEGTKAVNSLHHQAVKDVAPGFRITAYAPDGVAEAIEAWPARPMMGVQWHPEQLTMAGDTVMEKILRFLVAKADTFRLAKEIHDRILSLDTHTGRPLWFDRPGFDTVRREPNRVILPQMEEGVVERMNRQGMIIDLSHASDSTFWDVLERTSAPVICSHSSAGALCDHDLNLTDDQLRALAQNGGVVRVCLLNQYLHNDPQKASPADVVAHIDHLVRVAGIDHVGIGSDFDGGGCLPVLEGSNDLIQITVKLLEKGYREEDIAKIWGGNFLRVMREVQEKACR